MRRAAGQSGHVQVCLLPLFPPFQFFSLPVFTEGVDDVPWPINGSRFVASFQSRLYHTFYVVGYIGFFYTVGYVAFSWDKLVLTNKFPLILFQVVVFIFPSYWRSSIPLHFRTDQVGAILGCLAKQNFFFLRIILSFWLTPSHFLSSPICDPN